MNFEAQMTYNTVPRVSITSKILRGRVGRHAEMLRRILCFMVSHDEYMRAIDRRCKAELIINSCDITINYYKRMLELVSMFEAADSSPFGPPDSHGVYGIFVSHLPMCDRRRLIYIGSSKNIARRILNTSHPYRLLYNRLSPNFGVYTKSIEVDDFVFAEKILIRHYRPLLNKVGKNG